MDAATLLEYCGFASAQFAIENQHLFSGRKPGAQFAEGSQGIFGDVVQYTGDRSCVPYVFEEHDVINRQGKELARFAAKIFDTVEDGGINNRMFVKLERDPWVIAFEKILVDAVMLIEESQSRLEAFGEGVNGRALQAFIVEAVDFEDGPQVACLGQENLIAHESIEIALPIEGASLLVISKNALEAKHGSAAARSRDGISQGRIASVLSRKPRAASRSVGQFR